jgi:uncharacterized protein
MYEIVIGRSKADREKYGTRGAVLLGRQYVTMGQTTSLSNNVYMDMVRSHVVLIVGKRGSGKCLHGGTLITLSDGSQKKIRDLAEDKNGIYTLNADLRIKGGKKSHFYKRTVQKLLEITLRSGKSVKVTPEHPLFTVKGWLPAEQLNLGSRIGTPRMLPSFGDKAMESEKVKLLAYLIAEGHLGNGFVLFSNIDNKIIADFTTAIKDFDKNLRVDVHSKEGCFRVSQIKKVIIKHSRRDEKGQFIEGPQFAQSSIRQWLEGLHLYGKKSLEKFIPDSIFTLPKHQLALFLNLLFSCDGTIYRKSNHWFVSYCSSSDELIAQVQHLLLRFGIISRIRRKLIGNTFPTNELEIYGENVHTYLQEIGFFGKKEERAKIALREAIKIVRNPNIDTIPKEIWDLYRPKNWAAVGRKLGYAHPKALRESTHYSPSRQKLLQIARADESELIEKFATSDIFWDEITSLRYLDGKYEVYDLTVPETHNFVANDIIVHNSYTMGAIAEGMADLPTEIKKNLSIILLDTMGVYWTMKYPNRKEHLMLQDWNFEPKGLDVQIYTPTAFHKEYKEKGIPTDFSFSLQPNELSAEDWCTTFGVGVNQPIGVFIERIINNLRDTFKGKEEGYGIADILTAVDTDKGADEAVRGAVKNRFVNTQHWGLFDKKGTAITDLAQPGKVTILDVSCYATMPGGWDIKCLVVGLISQKLFMQRMLVRKNEEFAQVHESLRYFGGSQREKKQDFPLVWLVVDEAHEFLPKQGKTTATAPLITILREGRQPGISLILATQQPGKIHTDVMTQADSVISHRITAKLDTEALGTLMQSYMREGLSTMLDHLPRTKGSALIFDDTNERMFPIKIRPRFTWHGGESPTAMHDSKKEFKLI